MCNCQQIVNTIAHGIVGLTKVALQIGIAPKDVIELRRNQCRKCEFATRNSHHKYDKHNGLTNLSICKACSCNIAAKTQLSSEHCPRKIW